MGKSSRKKQLKELISKERFDDVGIRETIKQNFSDEDLKDLSRGADFGWHWSSAQGHSRGILLGVR